MFIKLAETLFPDFSWILWVGGCLDLVQLQYAGPKPGFSLAKTTKQKQHARVAAASQVIIMEE
jgi:hypothetical protein